MRSAVPPTAYRDPNFTEADRQAIEAAPFSLHRAEYPFALLGLDVRAATKNGHCDAGDEPAETGKGGKFHRLLVYGVAYKFQGRKDPDAAKYSKRSMVAAIPIGNRSLPTSLNIGAFV